MEETFGYILMEMNELQDWNDREQAHRVADENLMDLVDFLGKLVGYKREVREILEAYEGINKWYA